MIRHPEITPSPTTEVPGPDLFMTVIKVADWLASLAWYVETLGLLPILTDAEHQFALLAAGTGRLALQGDPDHMEPTPSGGARLVFLVPDVDEERKRLIGRGVEVGPPVDNTREGYREIRLHDPDGTPLTLFSWTDPARRQLFGNPPK
jgi:catechol 2,3-dioxygenase-like lactoylglutathione lyase family enzyme